MSQKQKRKGSPRNISEIAVIAIVGVIAIVAAFIYQSHNTDGFNLKTNKNENTEVVAEVYDAGAVRLNEIMTANDSAFYTADGETSDWIEVMNTSSSTIDIAGYMIAKTQADKSRFTFPKTVLAPGESALVFCDKQARATSGYEYHAPFSLSRSGDTLMLFNPSGTAIDSINIPVLQNNESYARVSSTSWEVTSDYTPGMENTSANHEKLVFPLTESPIEITEIVAKNVSYAPTKTGEYFDYIEIHNTSSSGVDISGYHLSDKRDDVMRWAFPDGTVIGPDGYLIVYCSGKGDSSGGELHSTFKLSTEGEFAVLSDKKGHVIEIVEYGLMQADQAYSKDATGSFGTYLPPTPAQPNTLESAALIQNRFAAQNLTGVYISEISASTTRAKYDWVELYNSSNTDADLSGYYLSDDIKKPHKWQFPAGTKIPANSYVGVFCSGLNTTSGNVPHTSFRLSIEGGYTLCIADPEGKVIDRLYAPTQFSDISFGRLAGDMGNGYYFTTMTPGSANTGDFYARKAQPAKYSVPGGMYTEGQTVTVELSAAPGDRIYYTLDFTDPTQSSNLYTGPITLSETSVLRTRVYGDNALESYMDCQTYFFGVSHTMRVISFVSDPYNLTSEDYGIMVKGPNADSAYPYKGANFWQDWEREAHIEIYDTDGSLMVSQECGVKLQGQYSRAENQKSFKFYARKRYSGSNRFDAELFTERGYGSYRSFNIRPSGEDGQKTRLRDSILTSLAKGSSVFYQETELCVVYIDGVYWGQYNMREHIDTTSICQFEGWEGMEDDLDLVKANNNVFQGSNDSFAELLTWVKSNDTTTDSAYEKIGSYIDIRNYIEYMSVEIFTGNTDTLNVKRYRNPKGDGLWRWVLFDLDWAFYTDTDSIARWIKPGGMGNALRTDNTLFIACMKNPRFRDEFLTYFGEQLATTYSTANILSLVDARVKLLEPEMPMQSKKWGPSDSTWRSELRRFTRYAEDRPLKLLKYFQKALNLSNDEMKAYFTDAYEAIKAYKASKKQ